MTSFDASSRLRIQTSSRACVRGAVASACSTFPADGPEHARDEVCIRNLLDASNEVIYFKDLQSRFIRVSLGYGQLHRMAKEKIVGLTDFDLFARAHAEAAYADEQRIIATGEPMINHEE